MSENNLAAVHEIVIIGAEAAGMSAAAKARRVDRNARITVFEQSDVISFGACGLPYYIGDFFDNAAEMSEFSPADFAKKGIDVHVHHRVEKVDVEQQQLTVRNLTTNETFVQSYHRLLIATGASPVMPPVAGLQEAKNRGRASFVKTMQDGIRLKETVSSEQVQEVAVIGAGYIGLEMVEALERQGKKVRLFDSVERPLQVSFDQEIGELVMKTLVAKGIHCHWQERLTDVAEGADGRIQLTTDKGQYETDLIVLCTGVRPNTAFLDDLNLERTGNSAIVVDKQARTSINNLFAAGDCATVPHAQMDGPVWIPLATYANKLGRLAGEVMAGLDSVFPGAYGAACLKVLDLEAARVGLSEKDAADLALDYKTVVIKDKDHTNYYPGQSDILVKLIYEAGSKKILGGQIAGGRGAVLRVDALAAAIKGGLTTADLGMLDLCYAPPFARTWDALNVAGNVAK